MRRAFSILILAATLPACQRPSPEVTRGQAAIERYGCAACHTIPGINKAFALVGPSLDRIAVRSYIGGVVPNSPSNMAAWIQNPQALSPRTAMPNLHVAEADARDMASYLTTLR